VVFCLKALIKPGLCGEVGWFFSLMQASTVPRGMASTPNRNEDKKGSWPVSMEGVVRVMR
jgi:hypothetical protein